MFSLRVKTVIASLFLGFSAMLMSSTAALANEVLPSPGAVTDMPVSPPSMINCGTNPKNSDERAAYDQQCHPLETYQYSMDDDTVYVEQIVMILLAAVIVLLAVLVGLSTYIVRLQKQQQ